MRCADHTIRGTLVALAIAVLLPGCDDKKPPRPRGPVAAVIVDESGQRKASIQADGSVEEAAADGHGGWFVSGQFQNIGGYDRGYLAHIDADGDVDPDWDPILDRNPTTVTVSAHLAVGNGRVYMAGDFGSVDGKPRAGGAAVDAESGELVGGWAPKLGTVADGIAITPEHVVVATGTFVDAYDPETGRPDRAFRLRAGPDDREDAGVQALAVSGGHIYIGGLFRRVNGAPRNSLARVDARTGRFDRSWRPPALESAGCRECHGPVAGLAFAGSSVYAVGDIDTAGGVKTRGGLAAFDVRTGRLTAFRAPPPGASHEGFSGVYDPVAVVGSHVFVGGDFGAGSTHSFATLDPRTGKPLASWHPARRQAVVNVVVPSGTSALVAGDRIAPSLGGVARPVNALERGSPARVRLDPRPRAMSRPAAGRAQGSPDGPGSRSDSAAST
jgi:outer membrane protein assembly factor BamB